ncbi:MAG TPA: hypothetical protein VGF14_04680 [Alphaproteobacteria bacterium]
MQRLFLMAVILPVFLFCAAPFAQAADPDVEQLKAELQALKSAYQDKINALEQRVAELETVQTAATVPAPQPIAAPPVASAASPQINNDLADLNTPVMPVQQQGVQSNTTMQSNPSAFNPAIGLVLNSRLASYSREDGSVAGFAVGEEGERAGEGLSLGESELIFSANVDDMFTAQFTGAVVSENGEDGIEAEEAYVQTLGMPYGTSIKAGRMFANLGYMNEKHAHTDDFADRPLPYRAFLNNGFNDDGIQLSLILPTDLYTEVGAGAWRGDGFPAGNAEGASPGSYTAYGRVGGDIGYNQTWRLGLSMLRGDTNGEGRVSGEDGEEQIFNGDTNLYVADAKYTWAPTGNAGQQELDLQGEFFLRREDGTYEDTTIASPATSYKENQSGYYAQAVYQFRPQWRAGYRYTALQAGDVPVDLAGGVLDGEGHDPYVHSIMGDYTHSEFSRIRLQYNNDHVGRETDNQFIAQYIMSLGAHGAHKY